MKPRKDVKSALSSFHVPEKKEKGRVSALLLYFVCERESFTTIFNCFSSSLFSTQLNYFLFFTKLCFTTSSCRSGNVGTASLSPTFHLSLFTFFSVPVLLALLPPTTFVREIRIPEKGWDIDRPTDQCHSMAMPYSNNKHAFST